MKHKSIILILVGFIALILYLPTISGFMTSTYLDHYFDDAFNIRGLQINFTHMRAEKINFSYANKDIEIHEVKLNYNILGWITKGIRFKDLKIDSVMIDDHMSKNNSDEKASNQMSTFWFPLKHMLINDLVIDKQSLGKVDMTWHKKLLGSNKIVFSFLDLQDAKIEIESKTDQFNDFNFEFSVMEQAISGKVTSKNTDIILHLDNFKDVYPEGILVQNEDNQWVLKNKNDPDMYLAKLGKTKGFFNIYNSKIDFSYRYDHQKWLLKSKSRHLEVDVNSNQTTQGLIKFNQYPWMDKLLTGTLFVEKKKNTLVAKSRLNIFQYQSKDLLTSQISIVDSSSIKGKVNYYFENGDKIEINVKTLEPKTFLLSQTGILNKTKFSAKQTIKKQSNVYDIQWMPIQYGKYIWKNNQNTELVVDYSQFEFAPECFFNEQRGKVCFSLDIAKHKQKSALSLSYIANEKTNLSDWLPKQFIVSDLIFKGGVHFKYFLNETYPKINIEIEDVNFKFDPLVSMDIPISTFSLINRGEGQLSFDQGLWKYHLILNSNDGKFILDSTQEKQIQWTNILGGYEEDSYVISNGSGTWDQSNQQAYIDVSVQKGQINLLDYYKKISNPVKINRFNLPIVFNVNLNNTSPIGINILGIEGLVDINITVDEKESVWIANGEISMLPGGIFRKNVEPINIKEGKIIYYNNDVLDPFIRLTLEKTQTLLTRDNQVSNYKDETLGVRFYGKLQNYQMQTYSTPSGINEFVILQTILINPILYSSQSSNEPKNLFGALAGSVRELRQLLPVDQITFRPAEKKDTLMDPYQESSTVSMMKKISRYIGLYARIGSLPQDNIFSLIYRHPKREVGTQIYSNYESQGVNLVYSH
ncbi:MAG: hypothetical protein VX835_01525 [Pseudomonadota bacterium]|nr:hypothetical protein [Pseudomonadota bacterium]